MASEEAVDSFEQELLELLDVGYSIASFGMNSDFIYALLTKQFVEAKETEKVKP
jgi:hypothetical protein